MTDTDLLGDLMASPAERRWAAAERVKSLTRVNLPRLRDWNYGACEHHDTPTPACEYRQCGGNFFDHQTKSIAWFHMVQRGLDQSSTGLGKTNTALGSLCLAKHMGEELKTIIVCTTLSVSQWVDEARRFAPGLNTVPVTSGASKAARLALYASDWEVLVIGFHLFTRDIDALVQIDVRQLVSDDVDPIRNPKNKTHKAVMRLAGSCERVLVFNATALQMKLTDLWAITQPIGGRDIFGSVGSFEKRYVKREPVWIRIGTNRDGTSKMQKSLKMTGYRNLRHFRSLFAPMTIRHSYESVRGDMGIPAIMPPQIIPLEMHPAQRAKYDQLQQGVLDLIRKDEPPQQKMVSAMTAFTYGASVCTGLPALGEEDGPGASVKLDWVEEKVQGDWADQKVVIFARNIGTVEALQHRLRRLGVGYSTVWGKETNAEARAAEVTRFWNDPSTRVLIGTAAVERSLNLHCASVICFLDVHMNPARMTQLIGRIRRAGSVHPHVWTFYPTVQDSQESRYLKVLGARQALVDEVNDEDSAGLFERLTPEEIFRLIQP